MVSVVQTVCGQAYGPKKYSAMGIICQRAIVLHLGVAVLFTFVYWYSDFILLTIGQTASTSEHGQVFARGLILQLYAFALACPMQRFLQAQNIVNPLAYMYVGALLLHTLLMWICVLEYGLLGASFVQSLSWWILATLNAFYIVLSPSCRDTWTGLSARAFKGMWPYFKLTFAFAVMLCFEIWYFQALVLNSGYLPNPTISFDAVSIWALFQHVLLELGHAVYVGPKYISQIRNNNKIGVKFSRPHKFLSNNFFRPSAVKRLKEEITNNFLYQSAERDIFYCHEA